MKKKSFIGGLLALILVLTGVAFMTPESAEVKASDTIYEGDGFVSEQMDIRSYRGTDGTGHTTPKSTNVNYEEWIFAGWYKEQECENPIGYKKASGNAYAKFVPADTLSVKCQVAENTEGAKSSKLRIVSTVDSLNYYQVGFEITVTTEKGATKTISYDSHQVAEKIQATADGVNYDYTPNIFDVDSEYFTTVTVTNIPSESFTDAFYIRPYWVTRDNTKVYGTSRYARVEDGYENIVNVPVRVYSGDTIGTDYSVAVSYDDAKYKDYTYVGAYGASSTVDGIEDLSTYNGGDLFKQLTVTTDTENKTVTITPPADSTATADGTLVNLRFQYTGSLPSATRFAVTENGVTRKVVHRNLNTQFSGLASADTTWYAADEAPFVITSAAELYGLASLVNAGTLTTEEVQLGADIEVNTGTSDNPYSWIPIGNATTAFSGKFEGKGHTISGLYYADASEDSIGIGLFGYTADGSKVQNLRVNDSYFSGYRAVGSIAGQGLGDFERIYSDAVLTCAEQGCGGIVGQIGGNDIENSITNCWFAGEIIMNKNSADQRGGGIVGNMPTGNATTTLINCLNSGVIRTVRSTGHANLGGLCGTVGSTCTLNIEYSMNVGRFTDTSGGEVNSNVTRVYSIVGFFGGSATGNISNTYATTESASQSYTGGLGTKTVTTKAEAEYTGFDAYSGASALDFAEDDTPAYWVAKYNSTPVLKSFADAALVVGDTTWDGDGSEENPYIISTAEELYGLSTLSQTEAYSGVYFELGADITVNSGSASTWESDAPALGWYPIGNATTPFAGNFNGNGKTISGLYCVGEDTQYMGLFAATADGSSVSNLRLENSYFCSDYAPASSSADTYGYIGSVAGSGKGTFNAIYSNAILKASAEGCGGLVGNVYNASATFTNCQFDGEIYLTTTGWSGGGIVGRIDAASGSGDMVTVNHCLNSGSIESQKSGSVRLGGICGVAGSYAVLQMNNSMNAGEIVTTGSGINQYGLVLGLKGGTATINTAADTYTTTQTGINVVGAQNNSNTATYGVTIVEATTYAGFAAYEGMNLDFGLEGETSYWIIRANDTPVLRSFADSGIFYIPDTSWYNGTPEEDGYYTISTPEELYGLAYLSYKGEEFASDTMKLSADIVLNTLEDEQTAADWATDAPKHEWIPIAQTTPFEGTFDGQMNTISGIYCVGTSNLGLFGKTTATGTISNLRLEDSYFQGNSTGAACVGSIVGQGGGTIDTVYSNAVLVCSGQECGGIIGQANIADTKISNCWFDGNITLDGSNAFGGGGIAGSIRAKTTMQYCMNSGNINIETSANYSRVANLCGYIGSASALTAENCLVDGTITTNVTAQKGVCVGFFGGSCTLNGSATDVTTSDDTNAIYVNVDDNLIGQAGHTNTWLQFDDPSKEELFDGHWVARTDKTPALRSFVAEEDILTPDIKADTRWYDNAEEGATNYTLYTAEDLYGFAELAYSNGFAGKTVQLGANIIMNEGVASEWGSAAPNYSWTLSIGTSGSRFAGTFDGQGYSISGLYRKTASHNVGLFGFTAAAGVIKNVQLKNSYLQGGKAVGAIAAQGGGTFDTIYVHSDVYVTSTDLWCGGIIARMDVIPDASDTTQQNKITNCWFAGTLNTVQYGGGIVGSIGKDAASNNENPGERTATTATIEHCLNTGNITHTDTFNYRRVGGICGAIVSYSGNSTLSNVTITDCLSTGTVSPNGTAACSVIGQVYNGSVITAANVYGTTESCDNHYVSNSTIAGISKVAEVALYGEGFKTATNLSYNDGESTEYNWVARAGMVPALKSFAVEADTSGYDETAKTYTIENVEDLYGLALLSETEDFSGVTVSLMNDVTVNDGLASEWVNSPAQKEWTPIGATTAFAGTFEGNNHTISGLYSVGTENIGLFGQTTITAKIQNVNLKNSYFSGTQYIGSVVGQGGGSFSKIYSDAIVTCAGQYFGGVIGYVNAIVDTSDATQANLITNCWFDGALTGTKTTYASTGAEGGGMVGRVEGVTLTIEHCLNSGTVDSVINSNARLGGMCGTLGGSADVTIKDSLNTGKITADLGVQQVGAVIGFVGTNATAEFNAVYATRESNACDIGGINNTTLASASDPIRAIMRPETDRLMGIWGEEALNTTYWVHRRNGIPMLASFANANDIYTFSATDVCLDVLNCTDISAISDYGDGSYVYTVSDSGMALYNAYLNAMKNAGVAAYANNADDTASLASQGVYNAVFQKEDWVLSITHVSKKATTYLSMSTAQSVSEYLIYDEADVANNAEDSQTALYMMELAQVGNSFVIQLKNGHFVINDGGTTLEELQYLISYLQKLAPDGVPIIEAWTISHLHTDHFKVLRQFLEDEDVRNVIRVEGFYINTPNEETVDMSENPREVHNQIQRAYGAISLLKTTKGDTPEVYHCHAGERYYFNDITMDVMFTQEQVDLPNLDPTEKVISDGFNETSTWLMFTIEGEKILIAGDAGRVAMSYVTSAYDSIYIKADVLSAFHHGVNTYNSSLRDDYDIGQFAKDDKSTILLVSHADRDYFGENHSSKKTLLDTYFTTQYWMSEGTTKLLFVKEEENPIVITQEQTYFKDKTTEGEDSGSEESGTTE